MSTEPRRPTLRPGQPLTEPPQAWLQTLTREQRAEHLSQLARSIDPARFDLDYPMLWMAVHQADLRDDQGAVYDTEAGMFRPEGLPEFAPTLAAWTRGTPRSKLRILTVVCPADHVLCEVYPPGVVFTTRYVRAGSGSVAVLPEDRRRDEALGRRRLETADGLAGKVPAVAVLAELTRPRPEPLTLVETSYDYGRASLNLECCVAVELDPNWLAAEVASVPPGRRGRRSPAPQEMLSRTRVEQIRQEDEPVPRPAADARSALAARAAQAHRKAWEDAQRDTPAAPSQNFPHSGPTL